MWWRQYQQYFQSMDLESFSQCDNNTLLVSLSFDSTDKMFWLSTPITKITLFFNLSFCLFLFSLKNCLLTITFSFIFCKSFSSYPPTSLFGQQVHLCLRQQDLVQELMVSRRGLHLISCLEDVSLTTLSTCHDTYTPT